jgi:hypothetical protein
MPRTWRRLRRAFSLFVLLSITTVALARDIYDAYTGEKRAIAQRGAGHVAPLDDATMAELHDAMDWMLAAPK